jgi:acetate kinase
MTGRVLVLNCGSSSLKWQVVDPGAGDAVASGQVERIGQAGAADHEAALQEVLDGLDEGGEGLAGLELVAVAHRVVHGGERFSGPVRIDDDVVAEIRDLSRLAPLHNPAAVLGIEAARRRLGDLPHVAVFDTAFHRTLPPRAATYAVPRDWREQHGVRRYGFHGTSYAHVSRAAAELLGLATDRANLVVLHLGNGASATAVEGGRSVDTSMGLTPLEGLVMGTRSGDVDPALFGHLQRTAGLGADEVQDALQSRSGMRALAGDSDLREVHRRADAGDADAALALDVYCHRVRRYVGAFMAVLGRTDAIVFTAGVGEHDAEVRRRTLAGLEPLGIHLDEARNRGLRDGARAISADGSPVAVLVVPTDEELEMARQTRELLAADVAA